MADAIEQRDFFISFNGADLPYAEAIDKALRTAGFTTFFHPKSSGLAVTSRCGWKTH